MRKSKNTIYKETDESRELYLCAINESKLYPVILGIRKMLAKKLVKGTYEQQKAVFAYTNVADEMARIYVERFGAPGDKYYNVFNVTARYTAAADILESEGEEIKRAAEEMIK